MQGRAACQRKMGLFASQEVAAVVAKGYRENAQVLMMSKERLLSAS